MIDRARLSTPRSHLSVLVEPSPARLAAQAAAAAADPRAAAVPILDTTAGRLRASLRTRIGLPPVGPLFVTGHQAEFYHAGVLAKTIAADELARRCNGAALYVTVDYDTPKTARLAVPQRAAGGPRRIEVAIPGCDLRAPVIFQPRQTRAHWLDFFARIAGTIDDYRATLLGPFADAWCQTGPPDEPLEFAAAMSRGQRACEARLQTTHVRELGGAALCDTPEFRTFVAHVALHAAEFAPAYNAAQNAYRARHGVRNRSVPAPHLALESTRIELPFWLLRAGEPRRRLFVTRSASAAGDQLTLLADAAAVATFSVAEFATAAAHERPWPLAADGWLVRPRALLLSGFLRLLLADLFVHGIGGAKYDEMTEYFCQNFFGTPLAPMACVTATALADLPRAAVRIADLVAARRRTRDVRYNPQRYVRAAPAELLSRREHLIHENAALRDITPQDRSARRRVYNELRRLNADILAADPWRPAQLADEESALAARLELDRVAADREYFFALLPSATMHALQERVRVEIQA